MDGVVAIGADTHGNYHALEAVAADMEKRGIPLSKLVHLGDIVGYNAHPERCVQGLAENGAECILGNHGVAVLKKRGVKAEYSRLRDAIDNLGQFNDLANAAVDYTDEHLSDDSVKYLAGLPFAKRFNHSIGTHAGIFSFPDFGFYFAHAQDPDRLEMEVDRTFMAMESISEKSQDDPVKISFIGHSHVPGYIREGRPVFYRAEEGTTIHVNASQLKLIIDVGSIGQPRDGDPRASWVEYDIDKGTVTFRRRPYDAKAAALATFDAGLPPYLATRLLDGI